MTAPYCPSLVQVSGIAASLALALAACVPLQPLPPEPAEAPQPLAYMFPPVPPPAPAARPPAPRTGQPAASSAGPEPSPPEPASLPVSLPVSLPLAHANAEVSVCFTPAEHCQPRIVAAIEAAQREIRVQAYGFTAKPILAALAAARARGVDVAVILDKSDDPAEPHERARFGAGYPPPYAWPDTWKHAQQGARTMAAAGIPVWIDWHPAIAHSKLMLIDRRLVIGGSYNFTRSAEMRNAENVLFIESPEVTRRFLDNWAERQAASKPWTDTMAAETLAGE